MDYVAVTLAGREYRLRFTPDDIQDICRRLTTFQPVGAGKVTPTVLGNLLMNLDPDAFQYCYWAGLRHSPELKMLEPPDAQKLIRAHINKGGQYTDFRRSIFKALIACGLADFSPIVKILDDEEASRAEDGAVDTVAHAEDDEDATPGNGLPPATSPTRSWTPASSVADSDSSR